MKAKYILFATLFATTFLATAQYSYDPTAGTPLVPAEICVKGRQAVTAYLKAKIDYVLISYAGNSVITPYSTSMNREWLRRAGYIHDGSFDELSTAISSVQFVAQVVKTPDMWYDIVTSISCYTADNRLCMYGYGRLDVYENQDGSLSVGQFQPEISTNENIGVTMGKGVTAAKWLGEQYNARQLQVYNSDEMSTVLIQTGLLDNGYLVVASSDGTVSGWDLDSDTTISGQTVVAILGKSQSTDIAQTRNPDVLTSGNVSFYANNGLLFGRFPLQDVIMTEQKEVRIDMNVPVWGSSIKTIAPSAIYVTALYIVGDNQSGIELGVEYTVDPSNSILLPIGEYNVRTTFDGVNDWATDNGSYGGKG